MDPIFTEEQLNRMSREDMLSLVKMMQDHYQEQETRIQLLEEKNKGTGIPECDALGPSYPCPKKTVWCFQ